MNADDIIPNWAIVAIVLGSIAAFYAWVVLAAIFLNWIFS